MVQLFAGCLGLGRNVFTSSATASGVPAEPMRRTVKGNSCGDAFASSGQVARPAPAIDLGQRLQRVPVHAAANCDRLRLRCGQSAASSTSQRFSAASRCKPDGQVETHHRRRILAWPSRPIPLEAWCRSLARVLPAPAERPRRGRMAPCRPVLCACRCARQTAGDMQSPQSRAAAASRPCARKQSRPGQSCTPLSMRLACSRPFLQQRRACRTYQSFCAVAARPAPCRSFCSDPPVTGFVPR